MRMERKYAQGLDSVMMLWIKQMHLGPQHNTRRVFAAWDEACGYPQHTIKRFYKDGVLTVTMTSSVLSNHLSMQKSALVKKMNAILQRDMLFLKDEPAVGFVKDIKIK